MEHAFITGHWGTPCPKIGFPLSLSRKDAASSNQRSGGLTQAATQGPALGAGSPGDWESVHRTPGGDSVALVACILGSAGDAPEVPVTRGIRNPPGLGGGSDPVATEHTAEDAISLARDARSHVARESLGEGTTSQGVYDPSRVSHPKPEPPSRPETPPAVDSQQAQEDRQYAVEPAEVAHRRVKFFPYNLRSRNRRGVTRQIEVQVRPAGMPFDDFILRQAGIKRFNPAIPIQTDTDLLYDCSSVTGRGITIAQFGKIFMKCMTCDHYVLSMRSRAKGHSCNGLAVDVNHDRFWMSDYFFNENYLGLTDEDFKEILTVCDTCLRVHLVRFSDSHRCPLDVYDHDFVASPDVA